ncbi:MAG TPA: LysR family transcriptional regulator [Nocardioides sp.]
MEIDPRRLRFLVAVSRCGGILAAAEHLGVSPSAVSQQVARLERETGQALIRRTVRGTLLTPAGVTLAEAGEEVERTLNLAAVRLDAAGAQLSGTVRVGGFESFLRSVLVPALPRWRLQHPDLEVLVMEAERDVLMRRLRTGHLDVAIIESDVEETAQLPAGVAEHHLMDDPWRVVAPVGALESADLEGLRASAVPWLGVVDSEASARAIARVRRGLGLGGAVKHAYFSLQTALALVAAGEGVALAPALALQGLTPPGVVVAEVDGLGMRTIVVRHHEGRGRTPGPAITVASLIRQEAAAHGGTDPLV